MLFSLLSPLDGDMQIISPISLYDDWQDHAPESGIQHLDCNITGLAAGRSTTPTPDLNIDSINPHFGIIHPCGMHEITEANLTVTGEPYNHTIATTTPLSVLGTGGIHNETMVAPTGVLTLNGSGTGPLNAGNSSLNVTSLVKWTGVHSFNTLHVRCTPNGCGSIEATGPLVIIATTIIVDSGATISADSLAWGGSGAGAGGQTGKLDLGANGGAHAGGGGVGGGNSNTTNMSYGNGSEAGSQGGNTSQVSSGINTVRSIGGRGGGHLLLLADTLQINGTISADGGDGANGPAPPLGGEGIAGAGGGSGGAVHITTNQIQFGPTGHISADGGDGGDGSNAVWPTGPSLLMYNGGDGAGGGGAGFINISHTPNGMTGLSSISVTGGSGGAGGQPLGTGTQGRLGLGGGSGIAKASSSFPGFSNGNYSQMGTWVSTAQGDGHLIRDATFSVRATIPSVTTVRISHSTSLDKTTWSAWVTSGLANTLVDDHVYIRYMVEMSTTDVTLTPEIHDIRYMGWSWRGMTNVTLDASSTPSIPHDWESSTPFFLTLGSTTSTNPHTTRITSNPVPVDAVITETHIVLRMDMISDGISATVTLQMGGTDVSEIDMTRFTGQALVEIPATTVQASLPTSGVIGPDGIEVATIDIDVIGQGWGVTSASLEIPWSWNKHEIDIVSMINSHVQRSGEDWRNLTAGTRIPFLMNFKAASGHFLTLGIDGWARDTIPPLATSIRFMHASSEIMHTRIGPIVDLLVNVSRHQNDPYGNETHLDARFFLHRVSDGSMMYVSFTGDPLVWNGESYVAAIDTTRFGPEFDDNISVTIQLDDGRTTRTDVLDAAWLDIDPIFPVIDESSILVGDGTSNVIGENVHISLTTVDGRDDLYVIAEATSSSTEEKTSIPLFWNDQTRRYDGAWRVWREDLGLNEITFSATDIVRDERSLIIEGHRIDVTDSGSHIISDVLAIAVEDPTKKLSLTLTAIAPKGTDLTSSALITDQNTGTPKANIEFEPGRRTPVASFTSYVSLGSSAAAGIGASTSSTSNTNLITTFLQSTHSDMTSTNLAQDGATIDDLTTSLTDIESASPDVITLLPPFDPLETDGVDWANKYQTFLDEVYQRTQAPIFLAGFHPDPAAICGPNVSEPSTGTCYSTQEWQDLSYRSSVLFHFAAERDYVHLIPLIETMKSHPDWHTSQGHPNDLGHEFIASAFISEMDDLLTESLMTSTFTKEVDAASWSSGWYDVETHLFNNRGADAPDFASGPDVSVQIEPPPSLTLDISEPTDGSAVFKGAAVNFTITASCDTGCLMNLDVRNRDTDVVLATIEGLESGTHSVTLSFDRLGQARISFTLHLISSPVSIQKHLMLQVDEEPESVGAVTDKGCLETVLTVADDGINGASLNCTLENTGEGDVILRLRPLIGDDRCDDKGPETLSANDLWVTGCRLPAPEEGTESMAFVIEIWRERDEAWESVGPYRWVYADAIVEQPIDLGPKNASTNTTASANLATSSAPKSINPLTVVLGAGAVLGAAGITLYVFRGRRSEDENEMFAEIASGSQSLGVEAISSSHVESFAPMPTTSGMESTLPMGTTVPTWEQLPGGGAYQQMGATLVYVQSDGTPWMQQADGTWHR